ADLKNDERIFVVPLETKLDKFLVDFVEKKITAAAKKSKEAAQQL
ncbi:MAG TPA: tetraacyldisaccharide 4'-kinase, partial [Sutterellaceae bacterium]|nr:tetraacyldisaccharide 4'-kinase [Sutterellaceae bacterium]